MEPSRGRQAGDDPAGAEVQRARVNNRIRPTVQPLSTAAPSQESTPLEATAPLAGRNPNRSSHRPHDRYRVNANDCSDRLDVAATVPPEVRIDAPELLMPRPLGHRSRRYACRFRRTHR
jgi:hypothetical protein